MSGDLERLIKDVVRSYFQPEGKIPVGISNRHVHLSRTDFEKLFGPNKRGTKLRNLKQPGQYALEETVNLVGPRGVIEGVRILGPERAQTQVEVLVADTFKLGIPVALRDSGDLEDTPGLALVGPEGLLRLEKGVIVARRHVHASPAEARSLGIVHGESVGLETRGERQVEFRDVLVRVDAKYCLEFHVDIEEANAALLKNGDFVNLTKGRKGND